MRSAVPRVLVADDDATLCALVAEVLREEFGADVEAAGDGQAALAALQSRSYALLILDLGMPRADGFAVLRWLGARSPAERVPVVVCSAAHAAMRAEAAILDVAGVLEKPFDLDALLDAVRPFLQQPSGG
jgi:DNA-binding response OmpR family regulator